jgi:hypothetical protein
MEFVSWARSVYQSVSVIVSNGAEMIECNAAGTYKHPAHSRTLSAALPGIASFHVFRDRPRQRVVHKKAISCACMLELLLMFIIWERIVGRITACRPE